MVNSSVLYVCINFWVDFDAAYIEFNFCLYSGSVVCCCCLLLLFAVIVVVCCCCCCCCCCLLSVWLLLLFIDVGGVEGAYTSSYVDFHSLTTHDIDDVVRGDASLFRCRRVCRFGQWSTVVFYTRALIFGLVSVLLI